MNGNSGDNPTKRTKRVRKSAAQIAFERVEMVGGLVQKALPTLAEVLVWEEVEPLHFFVKARKEGGYLAMMKTVGHEANQVAFGQGNSPIEAMINLERRIDDRGYSDEKPWVPAA